MPVPVQLRTWQVLVLVLIQFLTRMLALGGFIRWCKLWHLRICPRVILLTWKWIMRFWQLLWWVLCSCACIVCISSFIVYGIYRIRTGLSGKSFLSHFSTHPKCLSFPFVVLMSALFSINIKNLHYIEYSLMEVSRKGKPLMGRPRLRYKMRELQPASQLADGRILSLIFVLMVRFILY